MNRLFVSFSGGRSSAMLCELVQRKYPNVEKVFLFANTGEEHWKTLEFVDKCDRHFGLGLVWVEAHVHHHSRKSTTHKVVDFSTAARKGEPFEQVIIKYGIPNFEFPHCTRELKLNPMYSYIKSIGWEKGSYHIALGIRGDEPKRISKNAAESGLIYPLYEEGIDKSDVLEFWRSMPFDLGLEEHQGNCKTCWKKSDIKHVLNIKENRAWYDFPMQMELKYGAARTDLKPESRVFFRSRRSTAQMLALADALETPNAKLLNRPDEGAGCSESCEAFALETVE